MILFSKANGQVMSLPDPALPASISLRLEGWGGFVGFKSIITRVGISASCSYQFLHSLGGQVYLYAFGDRIGDLVISGLAFDSVCGANSGTIGIERVLNYYAANRVTQRKIPIRVTIGALTTVSGYLLDVSADVRDTAARLWEFNLHLGLIPRDTSAPRKPEATIPAEADAGGVAEVEGEVPPWLPASEVDDVGSIDAGGYSSIETKTPLDWPGWDTPVSGPRTDLVRRIAVP